MSKEKSEKEEVGSIWEAAEAAKDAATKARAKATHATAVVTVSHEALANATKSAAEAHLAATEAEKCALDEAAKAREALEQHLGLPAQQQGEQGGAPPVPTEPAKAASA